MKNVLVEKFRGLEVFNFVWKGRLCWIGMDITQLLGYENPSKGIAHCISAEKFEVGKEYDVLKRDELKIFKKMISNEERFSKFIRVPKIVILYEEGLYGILQYSQKDLAIEFKR